MALFKPGDLAFEYPPDPDQQDPRPVILILSSARNAREIYSIADSWTSRFVYVILNGEFTHMMIDHLTLASGCEIVKK